MHDAQRRTDYDWCSHAEYYRIESYRNKNGFICLWLAAKLRKKINPFLYYCCPVKLRMWL